ncbi:axin isoform X2 [Onthophagus taurus]|uniref:axin isoform X2 n=1 Tax=Onthophagus taurus TaxID=166361 RepID=UPI000C20253B|nr:axin isoform X2 [Onthophagus taurus]
MTEREARSHHRRHTAHDDGFDHNLPRPPVPGEERELRVAPEWSCTDHRITTLPPYRQNYDGCYDLEPSYKPNLVLVKPDKGSETSPGCLRWAKSLHKLLDDPDGVAEFRKYLEAEGGHHADALDFWFACNGLRMVREHDRKSQLVKVIYRKYFGKFLLPIPDEIRREVTRRVKSSCPSELGAEIFDESQFHIENLINNTTYPNFLKSDAYLLLVQLVQNPIGGSSSEFSSESSSSSSSASLREVSNLQTGPDPLPIIYEDSEFRSVSSAPLGLTPGTGCMSTGYQTPNFRLTKDNLLVTQKHRAMDVRPKPEAYVDDGRSLGRSRRKTNSDARQARESAALNKETHLHQAVIPRTQRIDTRQYMLNPDEFAAILIEKLKCVKKEQDSQELLDRKLKESESTSSLHLANAICAKLQLEDDNDQDILDQHVSRVFKDLTPTKSPRSHSPTRNRWALGYRPRRKEKDGFSTFSSDSGNVHDYALDTLSDHKMVKSKSTPEYSDERFTRGVPGRRSSKKTLTDLTDSGVSVVSDNSQSCHALPAKDTRVIAWLMESDKGTRTTAYTHSELSGKYRGHRPPSAVSPGAGRHRKGHGSRSSSLERATAAGSLGPAQPFVADPNMPPLPIPNTAVQLEEARRRLLEEDVRTKSRQRNSSKYPAEISQSTQSTLRKSTRSSKPVTSGVSNPEDITIVVYSFYDEKVPYRTKIPGRQITLRQFKDFLPKKGNFRYFFKTECEELDNQVIQEEISLDNEVLPTFDGKIMAQIKPLD